MGPMYSTGMQREPRVGMGALSIGPGGTHKEKMGPGRKPAVRALITALRKRCVGSVATDADGAPGAIDVHSYCITPACEKKWIPRTTRILSQLTHLSFIASLPEKEHRVPDGGENN